MPLDHADDSLERAAKRTNRHNGPTDRCVRVRVLAPTGAVMGASRTLYDRLAAGTLTLWRDAADTPVALAGYSREIDGARRLGPVYTAERHRRHGYGAAVTAAACRRALDGGTSQLLLYADIDNPTSNTLYRRLGFAPVEDRVTLRFGARAPAGGCA